MTYARDPYKDIIGDKEPSTTSEPQIPNNLVRRIEVFMAEANALKVEHMPVIKVKAYIPIVAAALIAGRIPACDTGTYEFFAAISADTTLQDELKAMVVASLSTPEEENKSNSTA